MSVKKYLFVVEDFILGIDDDNFQQNKNDISQIPWLK